MASLNEREIDAKIPEKLGMFFERGPRYKVARGGRGGGKSRTISTALVIRGLEEPIRWLCARETQKSLKYSSRQILVDAINRLGLQSEYTMLEDEVRGNQIYPDGRRTIFIFAGIREMSVDSIKSLEDFDGIWISEAHNISENSWQKITPTFRKAGSEIWADYNPELDEDFIHRWCNDPPPNAKIVHVNYYDNEWFPEALRADMLHMKRVDPAGYRNVWLGEARNSVVGAVYGKEMNRAYEDNPTRIVLSPGIGIDRTKPVDLFFDLGKGDYTAIWAAQAISGWYNIVDYYENNGEGIEHYALIWAERARKESWNIGFMYLPFDGVDAQLHHGMTGSKKTSPDMVLRALGYAVRICPKVDVSLKISAVRTAFPQMRFNEPKCFEGIKHLRMYQWGDKPEDGRVLTAPIHDDHSHAADALAVLAMSINEPRKEPEKPKSQYPVLPPPIQGGYRPFS